MTFCPTCGQQADDGAAFCTGCGMDLRSPTVAAPASDRVDEGIVPVNQRLRSVVNFFSPKCQHCRTKGDRLHA